MSTAPSTNGSEKKQGLTIKRTFSYPHMSPFAEPEWSERTAEIKDEKGNYVYKQEGCDFPDSWSDLAVNVVASKYFYGDVQNGNGSPADGKREYSVQQLIHRVVHAISDWGDADGYFDTRSDADAFHDELAWLLLNQYGAFNSPVWFNVGLWDEYRVEGSYDGFYFDFETGKPEPVPAGRAYEHPAGSACFILGVEDSIPSIYDRVATEGRIFKYGSGCGTNNSSIRSSREVVSGGGKPSGPLSFMTVYDAVAKVTKSGGKVRRAAKMEILDDWHPDILEFIRCKGQEEAKAHALIREGYESNFNGEAYTTVCFQNSNMSVRFSDAFMAKVDGADPDKQWQTKAVTTGTAFNARNEQMPVYDVDMLIDEVAAGTWHCGDPGVHFTDTIQKWHTCKATGPINASNPCLRRGTRLLTKQGWRTVEELASLESAEIFDGISFVNGTVWKTGIKPVIRLHANNGRTIDLTPDHKVHTENGWIEALAASELKIPYVFPVVQFDGENQLPKCITGGSGKLYANAGVAVMESLGFLQGDGSARDNSTVTVYFTPDKDRDFVQSTVIPTLSDIAADKGESYSPSPLSDGRNGLVFCRSKLHSWLMDVGFDASPLPERRLPNFIWRTTLKAQASFLRGLFGANGNICCDARNAIVLVSSCRDMLKEVQLILQSMGIASAVRIHNKEQEIEWRNGTYVSKESYHLEITHYQDIIAFARKIGFPQECQSVKLSKITGVTLEAPNASDAYRSKMTVVKVEDLGIQDEVYDFRCETTHAGLANGIVVHNCSEFLYLDNTACNLASLNLVKFTDDFGLFDYDRFEAAVRIFFIAQEILVDRAGYPTSEICQNSHDFRPLGLGYCNLGASLMRGGMAYDSDEARSYAAAITAIMHGRANLTSIELAEVKGPFNGYEKNRECFREVMNLHHDYASCIDETLPIVRMMKERACELWSEIYSRGSRSGFRNAQATLLAPTGTIAFMMDADTTGIEPDIALVKYKQLAGRGVLKIVNQSVVPALRNLGYDESTIRHIIDHIDENDTIEGAPFLKVEHLPVFDCAFAAAKGERAISWKGHIDMMAAVQPFLAGAISKTANVPEHFSIKDIRDAYIYAWKQGLKCVAIYRENSKASQPLNTKKDDKAEAVPVPQPVHVAPQRKRLPDTRQSVTHKFSIGGHEGYLTVGLYPDGVPGELFVTMAKEGSTVGGLMDQWATAVSIGLQYGVPLDVFASKFAHSRYEPSGFTPNPNLRMASSLTDYIARFLELTFLPKPGEEPYVPISMEDFVSKLPADRQEAIVKRTAELIDEVKATQKLNTDSPVCSTCGGIMQRAGTCHTCTTCGSTSGCG